MMNNQHKYFPGRSQIILAREPMTRRVFDDLPEIERARFLQSVIERCAWDTFKNAVAQTVYAFQWDFEIDEENFGQPEVVFAVRAHLEKVEVQPVAIVPEDPLKLVSTKRIFQELLRRLKIRLGIKA